MLNDSRILVADALLLATGFDLFEARKKEEYGYGIYDNVITSADLEKKFALEGQIRECPGKSTGKGRIRALCRIKR